MWVLFVVLATLFWSFANLIDKFALSEYIRNPNIPLIFVAVIGIVSSFIIYILKGFVALSLFEFGLSILAGILYVLSLYFYFHALKIEEVSRVIPLFYLSPIFVLIFAFFLLKESLSIKNYIGIFLLVLGAMFLSFKKHFRIRKAFWLMFLADIPMALSSVISKYLFERIDFLTVYSYIRLGVLIAVLPLPFIYYDDFKDFFKKKIAVGMVSLSETFNILGVIFSTFAIAYGLVSLVSALTSIQPLVVLGLLLLLSVIDKRFIKEIKEHLKGKNLFIKIISVILIVVGAALVV